MSDPLGGLNVGPPPTGGGGGGSAPQPPAPIGVPRHFNPALPPEALTERTFVPAIGPPGPDGLPPIAEGKPRYLSGFELTPANWGIEDRVRLQEALDSAGLYGPNGSYVRGWWDNNSTEAFKRLLANANQVGKTWETSIVELATLNQASAGRARKVKQVQQAQRSPVYTEITSPDDLKRVFGQTARQALGRRMTEDELNTMVKAYSGIEMAEAQKRIAAQQPDGTSNIIHTPAPSPTAFAERSVQSTFGEEAYASRFAQKFDVFNRLLGGSG